MKRLSILLSILVIVTAVLTGCGGGGAATQTVSMGGQSMLPTLQEGMKIQIDTKAYATTVPQRGDIIAFKDDAGNAAIKRVVGLPGEKVEIKDGKVYINDAELTEAYLNAPDSTRPVEASVWQVPEKSVFVLGDNREHSADSRKYGSIAYENIGGKVIY